MSQQTDSSDNSETAATGPAEAAPQKSWRVFLLTFTSLALLWISFPPVGLFWLAWLAPIPLVWVVQATSIPGRRPYWQLYFAGLLYWLGTFYFIPIPHPLLWFGWFLVSAYMAIYTPMFVGMSRTLVHRFGLPSLIAVPIVWTGVEWIRSVFATGMAMVCLSHSQFKHPIITQVADLFGAYTLTFAMSIFATGIALALIKFSPIANQQLASAQKSVVGILVSAVMLAVVLLYGQYRLAEPIQYKGDAKLAVGLIQTSDDVLFRSMTKEEIDSQLQTKSELTWKAREQWNDLGLIVWPESALLKNPDVFTDAPEFQRAVIDFANERTQIWSDATGYPDKFSTPVPLLTGGGTFDPEKEITHASALLIENDGQVKKRYFKNHLVMFGEYVPFSDLVPAIKKLSPIGAGTTAGTKFEFITVNGVNASPSICFESTVPHLIRRQVNTLADQGSEPDVLINMTNDGWFFGTSCLDFHLACNVFRAIEMRKPHLICANTGFSGEIDTCGRLVQVGPRRSESVIRAEVRPIERTSLYRQWGDLIPMLFAGLSLLAGLIGWFKRRQNRSSLRRSNA